MSGVGRFIRKRRAKRAAFMADPAIHSGLRTSSSIMAIAPSPSASGLHRLVTVTSSTKQ